MSHTTSIRRALTVAGATGILALSVAGPASARPDPGNGSQSEWSCQTGCYEGGTTRGTVNTVTIDDNALELLQLGGGVLAFFQQQGDVLCDDGLLFFPFQFNHGSPPREPVRLRKYGR